jgi:hypothetical protein
MGAAMTRDELLALLNELERVVPSLDGWGYSVKECAICCTYAYPHNPDCELAKAIVWLEDETNASTICTQKRWVLR